MSLKTRFIALVAGLMLSAAAQATIVVANDEWTLSNTGFAFNNANATQFVNNLVAEFGPNIHAYSNNFGFTQSALQTAMNSAGATYTTGLGITFNVATLSTYDAIFLGGIYLNAAQIAVLQQYVSGGGSVYIAAGTAQGPGGAPGEAAAWNAFLSGYGLTMAGVYNGISGNVGVGGDAIFNGVTSLYQNNGNSLSGNGVVANGLYAVIRPQVVPVPGVPALLGIGLVGLAMASRRR